MILTPWEYFFAYLPRTPPEKSYSASISSRGLSDFFFFAPIYVFPGQSRTAPVSAEVAWAA